MNTNKHRFLIRRWGVRLCLLLWWSAGVVLMLIPALFIGVLMLPGLATPLVLLTLYLVIGVPRFGRWMMRRGKRAVASMWLIAEYSGEWTVLLWKFALRPLL